MTQMLGASNSYFALNGQFLFNYVHGMKDPQWDGEVFADDSVVEIYRRDSLTARAEGASKIEALFAANTAGRSESMACEWTFKENSYLQSVSGALVSTFRNTSATYAIRSFAHFMFSTLIYPEREPTILYARVNETFFLPAHAGPCNIMPNEGDAQ